ncbi:hypothetical protein ACP2W0_17690 [Pseudobacillus badius]|uniref:hypothetical protein n=1 Tax=Bacillus badius TaxID=1455 RepID=UPI003CF9F781
MFMPFSKLIANYIFTIRQLPTISPHAILYNKWTALPAAMSGRREESQLPPYQTYGRERGRLFHL